MSPRQQRVAAGYHPRLHPNLLHIFFGDLTMALELVGGWWRGYWLTLVRIGLGCRNRGIIVTRQVE